MSKEYLEAFETVYNTIDYLVSDVVIKDEEVNDCLTSIWEQLPNIKQALLRLEAIDNANPSEALELAELLECDLQATNDLVTRTINGYDYLDILETIKQALIKAEKEHNSVNLLMQELDCKDFAELRKYARCGYERLKSKEIS